MADHLRAKLVVDALQMALSRRRPGPGLVHRSDQGSQYVSLAFGQRARDAGIAVSMGSKGDCYDNAVAESFFAKLKKELVNRHSWPTRRELGAAVFEYVCSTTAKGGTPRSTTALLESSRRSPILPNQEIKKSSADVSPEAGALQRAS